MAQPGRRIRSNFQRGTITDDPLSNVATTINSAEFANLPAVSSDHLILVLDPTASGGDPEIVTVTAHTASATSATVTRGDEGSSARQHASGTTWILAPTTNDYTRVLDDPASDVVDPYTGQLVYDLTDAEIQAYTGSSFQAAVPMGAWTSFTPSWTNLTPGSGATTVAKYRRSGRAIDLRVRVTLGTSPTVGDVRLTAPVTIASDYGSVMERLGVGFATDANGSQHNVTVRYEGSNTLRIIYFTSTNVAAALSASAPFTWVQGDTLAFNARYEAAS